MSEIRNVTISQFVPSGTWAHRESPFAKLNRGFNSAQPSENVLSSSWLWQALEEKNLRPRFAMGFPEEWTAFQIAEGSESLLAACDLDLWIFRKLDQQELSAVVEILQAFPNYRLIFAANHLSDWREMIEAPVLKSLFGTKRAFISFLPSSHEMDPFLKPQEVLWQLKDIPSDIPILIQDFPQSQSGFFQTLKKDDISQDLKAKNPSLVRAFRVLDRAGLGQFILFLEAFLSFLVSYRVMRLFQAVGYFFQVSPWFHKLNQAWVLIWHRAFVPVLTSVRKGLLFVWYHSFFKIYDWSWNFGVRKYGVFLWHRFLWPVTSFIWYKLLPWPLLWHRILWPTFSFIWHQLIYHPLDFLWNAVIRRYSILFWHRVMKPFASFVRYKVLLKIWIFLRYRMVEILIFLAYPLRKIYWFASYQYDKRIRFRKRFYES